jgi:hypothetical protein
VQSFAEADWSKIETLRRQVDDFVDASSLEAASVRFVELFANNFDSVILARLFAVLPYAALPPAEQRVANAKSPHLAPSTPVLSLMATRGKEPAWCLRTTSVSHRAIPLLSSSSVTEAPMVAKLLSDLDVDLKSLDDGKPIATRQMLGGKNGTFFVPDAEVALDERGRHIISSREFAARYGVRTVFGMGGAYMDGTLVVAIAFLSESLERLVVDRFPSFIGSFKTATTRLVGQRRLFESPGE